jgi:hypothetical protein
LNAAYDTYQRCKNSGIKVSEECKHTLLDALSINNDQDFEGKTNAKSLENIVYSHITNPDLDTWK